MTDASGVPTSPDNIPTYNTSNDAPSGLGFNTAMAQIQAIITNLKAGTLASGKILASALSGIIPTANLGSGTANSSSFLRGDQTWASPTAVLDYKEVSTNQTTTTTSEATSSVIVAGNSVTYDGSTPVWVEFFCPAVQTSAALNIHVWLWDNSTSLGEVAAAGFTAATTPVPIYCRRKLTPSAGAHTFSIRSSLNVAGTATFIAGTGGAGTDNPMFVQITKA